MALQMGPDVEDRIKTMLHGDDYDWQQFMKFLDRKAEKRTKDGYAAGSIAFIEEDGEGEGINSLRQETRIRAAMDSGSCRNVTHPKTLPAGVKVTPNTSGKHFSGAGGEVIEKFGECITNIESSHGVVGCRWNVADVTRPLHSVSQIAGPYDGDGDHDILFNNKRCVVVPPGVVEAVMQHVDTVAEYHRDGNLYLSDFTVSDFVRQGPEA